MSLHIDIEKDTLYKKGMEKGMEKMKDELQAQKKIFVINLINNFQLDDPSIAATAGVTPGFVKKIRKELGL
jgi:adenine-specific DNA methylase